MQNKRLNQTLRLTALFAAVAAALMLSGCSLSARGSFQTSVSQDQLSAGNEPYFNVGGITFQIQESRALNPYSDDVDYFAGLKGAQTIPSTDFWYGVFVWAKNQNKATLTTPGQYDFTLTDSAGNTYSPTLLNPNINQFAWTPTPLLQNGIEPDPDSVAASGTSGGGLILFKLPESAYQNRPLTLHIYPHTSPAQALQPHTASAVSLDL